MDASALQRELARLRERHAERPAGRSFAPLADCYRKLGQPRAALELLLPGLDRHPDYNAARVILGKVYLDLGDAAAARRCFERVLQQDSFNLVARRQAALLAEADGDWPAAQVHWQLLRSADPTAEDAANALARVDAALEAAPPRTPAGAKRVPQSPRSSWPTAEVLEAKLEPDPEPKRAASRPTVAAAEGIVTATLARIYREQGFASRALEMYEQLQQSHPEAAYEQAIRELRSELSRFAAATPSAGEDLLAPSVTSPQSPPPAPRPEVVAAAAPATPLAASAAPATDFDRFRKWLDRNKVRS